jgi:transcriptional regulator with XRE-family HTH domain
MAFKAASCCLAAMTGQQRVAWNLRRLRVERGLSQERLAIDANVDPSYVSQIETQVYNPTVGVLDKLARAMGVDLAELFAPIRKDAAAPVGLKTGPAKSK